MVIFLTFIDFCFVLFLGVFFKILFSLMRNSGFSKKALQGQFTNYCWNGFFNHLMSFSSDCSLLILISFLVTLPPRLAPVRTEIILCQLLVSSGSVVAFWGGGGILSKSWLSPAGAVRLGFSEGFLLQWRTFILIRERLQSFCPSLAGCSCSSLCVTCVEFIPVHLVTWGRLPGRLSGRAHLPLPTPALQEH